MLLFDSRLKLFSGKLKSHWFDPCEIVHVSPHGVGKVKDGKIGLNFKVNG